MTHADLALQRPRRRSVRQEAIRRRSRGKSLRSAARIAAERCFRFKYRAASAVALWSGVARVWLGRETFLHWSFSDASIDIPWLVAHAIDAPADPGQFLEALRAELIAYWNEKSKSLPRKGKPHWLPLP